MNNKITFPELTDLLAKSTNASKKTCENFLKDFFGAIESALIAGESVKIKGLGVFKVQKVEARKSVHVNTGEEIEIPEHNKIVFTPDKDMADAVNNAFAEFETIELDDDAASKIDNISDDEPGLTQTPNESESANASALQETENQPTPEPPAIPHTASPTPPPVPESDVEDSEADEPESSVEQPQALPETPQEIASEHTHEEVPTDSFGSASSEDYVFDDENDNHGSFKKGFFWGATVGVVATLLSVCALTLAIDFPIMKEVPGIETTDSLKVDDDSIKVKSIPKDSSFTETPTPKAESGTAVRTDTIGKTRFLTTMAREYYGDYRFWVYIYKENESSLGDPDQIPRGTVVIIPNAEKYGIDKNNQASINKAEILSEEIMSKYE